MTERGTTGWTDEPNASWRSYLYEAVEDEGAHFAVVIRVAPPASGVNGWHFEVRRPDGRSISTASVNTPGEPGRELARAMCDAALGHAPLNGYRIERVNERAVPPRIVVARNGDAAGRAARRSGESIVTFRVVRLRPRELRAYYRGDFNKPGAPNG